MSDDHMTDFDRFGKVTASVVSAIIRTPDETRSKKWAWRVITGREPKREANWDQQRGLDNEENAISALEVELSLLCSPGRFVCHPDIHWLGASPDGFVMEHVDGAVVAIPVEAKCPRKLHTEIPPMYYAQMQIQLACCTAPHGYFVSWVEDSDAQFVQRVKWDLLWWDTNYPVIEEFYREYVEKDVEPPKSARRKKEVA